MPANGRNEAPAAPLAAGPLEASVRPRFWMTRESEWRLSKGGNSKGAVPVHGKPSATAILPLYDQAALDAAIIAEREACARVCDARAKRPNDGNWTTDEWDTICGANELAADEIRTRPNA